MLFIHLKGYPCKPSLCVGICYLLGEIQPALLLVALFCSAAIDSVYISVSLDISARMENNSCGETA